jgi:hypothetical protein
MNLAGRRNMMSAKIGRDWVAVDLIAGGLAMAATPALAESYASLQKQGYKISKMSRGTSGAQGWAVSNGEKKYFCKLKASMAYVGSSGLVSILSNGKQIKLDRKTFEAGIGGPDANIPQLSDLKAGRPMPRDVGACSPLK